MSPSTSSDPTVVRATKARIAAAFRGAAAEDRAALVMYVTAGHPDPETTPAVLDMLAEEGVDVIEFGVPFSDPLADGPVIQAASNRAIDRGVDMRWVLRTLGDFRARHDTAVVLFSYLNPILRYGFDAFLSDASAAGADGVLLTDLPLGCDPAIERRFTESPLDLVRLVAPTSTPARAAAIARASSGFVYYVSRTGVTGEQSSLSSGLDEEVASLRHASAVPVAVGFGISTPDQAADVARVADGVVVGSALVRMLGERPLPECAEFVRVLRRATRRGVPR